MAEHKIDLAAIRARLADQRQIVETYEKYETEAPYEVEIYVRDVTALLAALDAKAQKEADRENRSNKESAKIPCPKCHGSGFTGRGSGYDDVCDCTGGYIGYVETQEKDG